MRTYKKSRRERWLKTRQKGFLHYILVRSLLVWGVTSAVVLLLLVYWLFDTPVINFAGLLTFIVYVLIVHDGSPGQRVVPAGKTDYYSCRR